MEYFVIKTRKTAEIDQKPIIRTARYQLADALEIMRNLFDGGISFYKSNLSPFKGVQVEQTQMERIRTIMQEITRVHIQEQINRIEEELKRSETAQSQLPKSTHSQGFFKGESTISSISGSGEIASSVDGCQTPS